MTPAQRENLKEYLIELIADKVSIVSCEPPPGMAGILYEITGIEKAADEITLRIEEEQLKP